MRIAGINLPENKRMEIALTAVYGIGRSRARKILDAAKVEYGIKAPELTADNEAAIRKEIESYRIEGDLSRDIEQDIKRLKDIKAYRGIRHMKHLPVRGQRTKTNSRTVRGNTRKTMGSGRKDTGQKT
jgi:small subunit ribosomal protein S13